MKQTNASAVEKKNIGKNYKTDTIAPGVITLQDGTKITVGYAASDAMSLRMETIRLILRSCLGRWVEKDLKHSSKNPSKSAKSRTKKSKKILPITNQK